jgi:hypothetical protein
MCNILPTDLCTAPACPPAQVPPEMKTEFQGMWEDAAYKTIKEDGNIRYKWVVTSYVS